MFVDVIVELLGLVNRYMWLKVYYQGGERCSVVTSVNHTSTRSKGNSRSPCGRCEHGVNKSQLSFDFRWFYLKGTKHHTPQWNNSLTFLLDLLAWLPFPTLRFVKATASPYPPKRDGIFPWWSLKKENTCLILWLLESLQNKLLLWSYTCILGKAEKSSRLDLKVHSSVG